MHGSISALVKQYVLKLFYIKIYLEIPRKAKKNNFIFAKHNIVLYILLDMRNIIHQFKEGLGNIFDRVRHIHFENNTSEGLTTDLVSKRNVPS